MGMRSVSRLVILSLTALTGLSGCAGPHYLTSRPLDLSAIKAPTASITRNVILVSIDGLRPDAIKKFEATTLLRLMREGSYSLSARTIMPSSTLPSHTSMLSGEPPEQHHVTWNNVVTAEKDLVDFSTVFSVARAHGYRTAAFFSKAKFSPLQLPGSLDYSQAPGGWWGKWPSTRTVGDIKTYLKTEKPNLLFVHLSDPDSAGHSSGWMSAAYGRAVHATDKALDDLLDTADEAYGEDNYSVVVTADHGGHGYGHGTSDLLDVTIPWIAWGRGVDSGEMEDVEINTFDTAPTVLWMLGVAKPEAWDGVPVVKAFHAAEPIAADLIDRLDARHLEGQRLEIEPDRPRHLRRARRVRMNVVCCTIRGFPITPFNRNGTSGTLYFSASVGKSRWNARVYSHPLIGSASIPQSSTVIFRACAASMIVSRFLPTSATGTPRRPSLAPSATIMMTGDSASAASSRRTASADVSPDTPWFFTEKGSPAAFSIRSSTAG